MKKTFVSIGIVFLFSLLVTLPLILPYFHRGYFPTHDGEWAVVRLGDMFRELRDHQFPARFSGNLNFGYGYPLFNFAYPLPYYVGIVFVLLKFGFVNSVKTLFVASVFFSAFFMFLFSSELWKSRWAGAVSAALYLYLPYRIVDLYVRGSLGESLAFTFFPLILFGIRRIAHNNSFSKYTIITAFSFSFLIMTHNIMTVLFLPILFLFIFLQKFIEKTISYFRLFLPIVIGLFLSSFFWIPALYEKQYILLSKIPIADRNLYFVSLKQLVEYRWGYGAPNDSQGFSYQIGIPHFILLFLTITILLTVIFKKHRVYDKKNILAWGFSLLSIIFVFLLFPFTDFLWKNIPLLSEINYPWISLGPIGFLVSLLGGYIATRTKILRYVTFLLTFFAIILFLPFAKPQYFIDKGDWYYVTNDATTTSSYELMPLWVKKIPNQRAKNKVEIVQGEGLLTNILYDSSKITFTAELKSNSTIRLNTIFYPGWNVFVDEKSVPISYYNDNGVIDILVFSGKHMVNARLVETSVREVSNWISVMSFVSLLIFSIVYAIKKQNV